MAKITYTQAAHHLRMSVKLLKWFSTYTVLGRKLKVEDGLIDQEELVEFDALLRGPWPTRAVPEGISQELKREARGRCTICDSVAPLEEAHIKRKNRELDHYCQHPHNLTLACPTCHTRFDRGDGSLTSDVIASCKESAQQRHMREVDADIGMRDAIARAVEPFAVDLRNLGSGFWAQAQGEGALANLAEIVSPVTGSIPTQGSNIEKLNFLSGSLASNYPVTSAQFESLAEGPTDDDDVWEHLDADDPEPPWMCAYGDEIALVEGATCPACGEESYAQHNEVPSGADYSEDGGGVVAYFEDARGDSYTPDCPKCGHGPLHYEFQRLCSYHEHVMDKWERD